jgi:hypothetical protein
MTINLIAGLNRLDSALQPVPASSIGWTEGVTIQKVRVLPSVTYLGETVHIEVSILYACDCSLEVPADIHGVVLIDGAELHEDFRITFRNPTLVFEYTPTTPGTFTISPGGVTLTVVQDVMGTYYSPVGGVRMPICADLLVPNVAPFTTSIPKFTHPGGDLLFSSLPDHCMNLQVPAFYGHGPSLFSVPHCGPAAVRAKLPNARPVTWDPTDATVNNWVSYFKSGLTSSLLIMATQYTCQEYWNSKTALADMMVQQLTFVMPIADWKQYGAKINLNSGLRDYVKEIGYKAVQTTLGHWREYVYCPYCNQEFEGQEHGSGLSPLQLYPYTLSLVRQLLVHIETAHPNHQLTEPAWF